MNGKHMIMLTILMTLLAYAGAAISQDDVQSLRGDNGTDQISATPAAKDWKVGGGRVPREFPQQPPLIPHATDGFTIDLKFNMCLNCHGVASSKQMGAPAVSESHLYDRDGKKLEDSSGLRFFCTQCHVMQKDAAPLVASTFKAANSPD